MNTLSKPATITYYYRGRVERGTGGPGYAWHTAYSENADDGSILYPWMTRRECFADAKAKGARAIFNGNAVSYARAANAVPAAKLCPYLLVLAHGPNEDIAYDERKGYWETPTDTHRQYVPVASFAEASAVFAAWRDRNGLGSGNMVRDTGWIKESTGKVVAEVSYNGRVWEPGQVGKKEVAS